MPENTMNLTLIKCPSCGGPNDPSPGASQMPCAYCGANLTIPKEMRRGASPIVEKKPSAENAAHTFEKNAPDLLRKAQPIAVKAWNAYAYWTWIRRLLPTCLTLLAIGFIVCVALGIVFALFQ
ncbi:MAG: hypothetical protein KPEEDBHJ_01217 [Anaerolineales bacterium]|nr:hypothetical protein [Anaerolineales bacterium]